MSAADRPAIVLRETCPCLAHRQDRDDLVLSEFVQAKIAGNDPVGVGGERAGNDVVIVGIALNHARCGEGRPGILTPRANGARRVPDFRLLAQHASAMVTAPSSYGVRHAAIATSISPRALGRCRPAGGLCNAPPEPAATVSPKPRNSRRTDSSGCSCRALWTLHPDRTGAHAGPA